MSWNAKQTGGYLQTSDEAHENMTEVYKILVDPDYFGWAGISVSAMIGTSAGESGYNPWRWQSDIVPTIAQYKAWTDAEAIAHGYGLMQFTPAKKYIAGELAVPWVNFRNPHWADVPGAATDGRAQVGFIGTTIANDWLHGLYAYYKDAFDAIGVNINDFYWMTFDEFKAGKSATKEYTIDELVGAFLLCYGRGDAQGSASSYQYRVNQAKYWQQYFKDNPPGPEPKPPTPTKKKKWKYIYYLNPFI